MKIEIDVPDGELPCELWLTLGVTGYEVHAVHFYDPEHARTVFDSWWQKKNADAQKPKAKERRRRAS